MKDNKFEDYNQKGSIKESLNIKKEENNSPFSDSFVFKKEENKITWTNEYCSDGKEVNSNLTKLNNQQEEKQPEIDQEKLQSSVSSTTAKIGTAVTTTAAVVTTAVVAVVGIDLVTTELVDELPQICEISEVVTTSETISFVLNIGNDEDEAYAEGADSSLGARAAGRGQEQAAGSVGLEDRRQDGYLCGYQVFDARNDQHHHKGHPRVSRKARGPGRRADPRAAGRIHLQ